MPGLRGDILSSRTGRLCHDGLRRRARLAAADEASADTDIVRYMRTRFDEVQQAIGIKVDISDDDLLAEYRTQRYQPFVVMENLTPYQVDKIQSAGLEAKGFGFQTAPLRSYPRGTELSRARVSFARPATQSREVPQRRCHLRPLQGAAEPGAGFQQGPDQQGRAVHDFTRPRRRGMRGPPAVAEPATYGNNVRLSIDSKIQNAMETAMAASPDPWRRAS